MPVELNTLNYALATYLPYLTFIARSTMLGGHIIKTTHDILLVLTSTKSRISFMGTVAALDDFSQRSSTVGLRCWLSPRTVSVVAFDHKTTTNKEIQRA